MAISDMKVQFDYCWDYCSIQYLLIGETNKGPAHTCSNSIMKIGSKHLNWESIERQIASIIIWRWRFPQSWLKYSRINAMKVVSNSKPRSQKNWPATPLLGLKTQWDKRHCFHPVIFSHHIVQSWVWDGNGYMGVKNQKIIITLMLKL